MAGKLKQIRILMWKNWLLKKRRPWGTLAEILVPWILIAIGAIVRVPINSKVVPTQVFPERPLPPFVDFAPGIDTFGANSSFLVNLLFAQRKVGYAPVGGNVDLVIDRLKDEIGNLSGIRPNDDAFVGFADEEAMLPWALGLVKDLKLLAAISFKNVNNGQFDNNNITYALRMDEGATPDTRFLSVLPQDDGIGPRTTSRYVERGFAVLKNMLDYAIMGVQLNLTTIPVQSVVQNFPYPEYLQDDFKSGVGYFLPFFTVLSLIYPAAILIKNIVMEKELRLREAMRLMGLRDFSHWSAWFITSLIMLTLSSIGVTAICVFGKVVQAPTFFMLFMYFMLASLSLITFSFMVSTWFSRARVAGAAGACMYFLFYAPYLFLGSDRNYPNVPQGAKLGACLLAPTCFGFGAKVISQYEIANRKLTWADVGTPGAYNDEFTMRTMFIMLTFDFFLYLLLALYWDNVFPGQYGIPKKFYYFLLPSYWTGRPSKPRKAQSENSGESPDAAADSALKSVDQSDGVATGVNLDSKPREDDVFIEPDPSDMEVGIEISDLRKRYGKGRSCWPWGKNKKKPLMAVDGLTFRAYQGQITSFLGHNGAGKTTTMSILAGLFPPTSGDARIYGNSVHTGMQQIRQSLGMCPQFDVLYMDLTVAEHLRFYCMLKDVPKEEISKEIDQWLSELNLADKKDATGRTLSGGMRRKLSVAIALLGGSKCVILDEPTAGMDPYARRATWDFILRQKEGRTILLSTHYMDEADLLGDRIVIIANGKMRCVGTSMFLKNRYGAGYHLMLTKLPGCIDEEVAKLVQSHVPNAAIDQSIGSELSFILPTDSAKRFESLFNDLDARKDALHIGNYGVSVTTMEEVFLKASRVREEEEEDVLSADLPVSDSSTGVSQTDATQEPPIAISAGTDATGAGKGGKGELQRLPTESDGAHDVVNVDLQGASNDNMYTPPPVPGSAEKKVPEASSDFQAHGAGKQVFLHERSDLKTGFALKREQFRAMVRKRMLHSKRDRKAVFCQLLLPVFFVAVAMGIARTVIATPDRPALTLVPSLYSGDFPDPIPAQDNTANTPGAQLGGALFSQLRGLVSPYQIRQVPPIPQGNMINELLSEYKDFVPQTVFGYQVDPGNSTATGANNTNNNSTGGGRRQAPAPTVVRMKGFYEAERTHASVVTLGVVNNAAFRTLANSSTYTINTVNHPLPLTALQRQEDVRDQARALSVSLFIIFAFSFLAASFVTFIVTERVSNAKHLQFVSGVDYLSFWLATYCWDLVNYLIPWALVCIVILAAGPDAYTGSNFPATMLILLFFGWAILPLMYCASFLFRNSSTAISTLIIANTLLGLVTMLTTYMLEIFEEGRPAVAQARKILVWAFLPIPNYCLGRGLMDVAYNHVFNDIVKTAQKLGPSAFGDGFNFTYRSPMSWNVAGKFVFFLFIEGFLYFGLLVLVENKFFWKPKAVKDAPTVLDEEEDVAAERTRVERGEADGEVLVIKELSKTYAPRRRKEKPFVAVKNLSVGIKPNECFGLLGVNGAGKTTTFKMLTGDFDPTHGDAFVDGHSVVSEMETVRQRVGYCPQYDALFSLMTARETLEMFARLRGLREREVKKAAQDIISMLQLDRWADRPAGTYSGGNKRKLSTGIALVAGPPVILLDEPTTGMDPKAKRFLWDTLNRVRASGRSIVLTSHSMEECEALCTRLAIMVNGQFMCIGSQQHLKSRYGNGYELKVQVKGMDTGRLQETIAQHFPRAELKEQHAGVCSWQLPPDQPLGPVFHLVETERDSLDIQDYLLTQTTLEQVFIRFAKMQNQLNVKEDDAGNEIDQSENANNANGSSAVAVASGAVLIDAPAHREENSTTVFERPDEEAGKVEKGTSSSAPTSEKATLAGNQGVPPGSFDGYEV